MVDAELVVLNADVVTVDDDIPRAEALAIRDGRILAVGTTAEVSAHRGPATEVVDLAGRAVLPGFVEAHGHPTMEAQTVLPPAVDIRPFSYRTHDQVMEVIARTVASRPVGEPQLFYGYDLQLLDGARKPDRALLDAVAPAHPIVVVNNSGHSAYANSLAVEAAGVTAATPDPHGSRFVRDAQGEPTGEAIETAATLALVGPYLGRVLRDYSTSDLLRAEFAAISATGVTTVSDMAFDPGFRGLIRSLVDAGETTARYVAYEVSGGDMVSAVEPGWGDDWFCQPGIKFWADGSPWVGNIETTFPYLCTPMTEAMGLECPHTGTGNFSPEEMRAICDAYYPKGWQMAVHVHGDRIADAVLDIYEDLIAADPDRDHRLRLEHCGALRVDQYQRCGRLGIACSLFVVHVHYWGDALIDGLFGPDIAANWCGARSALDAGARVSFHNDTPVTPMTPLLNMQVARTRLTRSGRPIGLHQRITAEEALRAVTIDAAWQLFMDDRVGSLAVGKLADFVVLDANPLTVPDGEVGAIDVVATYVGGRSV